MPLSGDFDVYGAQFERQTGTAEGALRYSVSPDYFAAMGIPLLRGRLLDEDDTATTPGVVLLSESLAKRKFPHQDPIGQRVRLGPNALHADLPWSTIVGVVGDVKQASLAMSQSQAFYTTTTQWSWVDSAQSLVVRTRGDAARLAPAIKNAIWSVDKDQPIVRVATMGSLLQSSEAQRRFALTLFEAFGMVALILAAVGIYGVLSAGVNERTREMGVRAALGASRSSIQMLVLRQGITLTGIGVHHWAAGRGGSEPDPGFIALWRIALRPCHLRFGDRAAHVRFSDCKLVTRLACGPGRSVDHLKSHA